MWLDEKIGLHAWSDLLSTQEVYLYNSSDTDMRYTSFPFQNSCRLLEKVLLKKLYYKQLYGWPFAGLLAHLFMEPVNLVNSTCCLMLVSTLQRKGMPWCMSMVKLKELA